MICHHSCHEYRDLNKLQKQRVTQIRKLHTDIVASVVTFHKADPLKSHFVPSGMDKREID
jgi:hypothetical protein